MKIKTFRVQNFKSIKDMTVEFKRDRGLWHITGGGTGNNVGKSALLEALRVHFMNVSNLTYKRYLKYGESTFTTELWDWEGNRTKLSRGADDFYEWQFGENGEVERANKTGGKVPDELVKYFNLYVESEKTKELVNYRTNDDKRLFTKTTEGDNFLLLQKALGTEDYTLANRKTKKLRNEVNINVKVVNKQLAQERIENELYKTNLDDINESIDDLNSVKSKVDKLFAKLKLINSIQVNLAKLDDVNNYIDKASDGLMSISVGDVKEDIQKLIKYNELISVRTKIDEQEKVIDYLKGIDIDKEMQTELRSKVAIFDKANKLIELSDKYQAEDSRVNKYSKIVSDIDNLEVLNRIKTLDKIDTVISCAINFNKKNKEYKVLVDEEDSVAKDITELKSNFDICPFCEQDMPHEHVTN